MTPLYLLTSPKPTGPPRGPPKLIKSDLVQGATICDGAAAAAGQNVFLWLWKGLKIKNTLILRIVAAVTVRGLIF